MAMIRTGRRTPPTPIAHPGDGEVQTGTAGYNGPTYMPSSIDSFVKAGERALPWDTLGQRVEGTNHDGLMTAKQVLELGGFDFEVQISPLQMPDGTPVPDRFATYRKTPEGAEVWGVVSSKYGVIQPAEGLGFFDTVIANRDGAHYSSVWSMRERRQMGVTIELPDHIVVDPKGAADEIGLYLLGVNSFDGSTSFQGACCGDRFWCFNQVFPRLASARRTFTVKHGSRISQEGLAARAQASLGIVDRYAEALDAAVTAMHVRSITAKQFDRILVDMVPIAKDASDLVKERRTELRDGIRDIYENSPTCATIKDTGWGVWNALSEWAEWGRNVKGTGDAAARNRAIGTMVGRQEVFLGKAWRACQGDKVPARVR